MRKKLFVLLSLLACLAAAGVVYGELETDVVPSTIQAPGGTGEEMPPAPVPPAVITAGDYGYWLNDDGTATIVEYNGEENGNLEIPSELDGHQVSEIGESAFYHREFASVTIPETVRSIGPRAFEYVKVTDELSLPAGIEIMSDAFAYGELPAELTIPAGATAGIDAFSYCDTLTKVILEENALARSSAFAYCENLDMVVCDQGTRLEEDAFEYCERLQQAVLCGDVEADEEAFSYCDDVRIIEAEADEFETWKQAEPKALPTGAMVGGWQMSKDDFPSMEADRAFHMAMRDRDDLDYEVVTLLATQVVAGINYCFLCRDFADESSYKLVYIWEDPQHNCQILEIKDLEIGLS